ncbi:hypothetical protein [Streptomyces sp. G-G2]|uniref:hypothetical protein n=1 Tax=Streptomyces sp. G-G2 TaxID=3046201 RepID=UPI0024BACB88|nr:hypothetical protein [Streptomyces sp. G-G2]MDJ0379655.1 hypothetical protein [Streptomyces sp. G-G2]
MRLREALALSVVLVSVPGPAAASPALAATVPAALAAPAPAAPVPPGGGGARPAPALPSRARATCGDGKSAAFPIGARIRGGPPVYRLGAGPQTWYLDLTNTTATECTAIHPVVVFTDKARALRPAHLRMEFEAQGAVLPVSLEHTDRDEIIAVFDGGQAFPGFTVGPGGSATVTVRLAFAADAPVGDVVADAALVQRKGDDGDWIGEAGGYRFSVEVPQEPVEAGSAATLAETGPGAGTTHARAHAAREWASGSGAFGALGALIVGVALLLGARRLRRP